MVIPTWFTETKMPIAACIFLIGGVVSYFLWSDIRYAHSEEVKRADAAIEAQIKHQRQTIEIRILEGQLREIDAKKTILDAKKAVTPQKFDAMDSLILKKYEQQFGEVRQEIKDLKR